jgi:hypothetical protein
VKSKITTIDSQNPKAAYQTMSTLSKLMKTFRRTRNKGIRKGKMREKSLMKLPNRRELREIGK